MNRIKDILAFKMHLQINKYKKGCPLPKVLQKVARDLGNNLFSYHYSRDSGHRYGFLKPIFD